MALRNPASRIPAETENPAANRLLAALPSQDYERLLPCLVRTELPHGRVLHRPGERESGLYFLTSGLVSCLNVTQAGASAEFASVGREGAVGVGSFLGADRTPTQAVVLRAGFAYRLAAADVQRELDRGGALSRLLMCYVLALVAQAGQAAVCNRHHSLEQQLCRWILSCLDRLAPDELTMTQATIGRALGVRRQTVARAAAALEEAGTIQWGRGRIALLDRAGLASRACECYGVVKREFDRLLPAPRLSRVAFQAIHDDRRRVLMRAPASAGLAGGYVARAPSPDARDHHP